MLGVFASVGGGGVIMVYTVFSMNGATHVGGGSITRRIMGAFRSHVREIVYGGVDGIITTFTVVSSFSGAALTGEVTVMLSTSVVLLFGFANLFADGVSMGLGGFLSLRAEKRLYAANRERVRDVQEHKREQHIQEVIGILTERGFSAEDAVAITHLLLKNEEYWLRFVAQEKFQVFPTDDRGIVTKSFSVFVAFIVFGAVPIVPFIFSGSAVGAFLFSAAGVVGALVVLGAVRGVITGERVVWAIIEVLLIGALAGAVAFSVGFLFRGVI